MSTAVKTKRPPAFTTDVDIYIDPEDLEDAGWVYVGKSESGDGPPTTETVLDTVRRWHDDSHRDPWIVCGHELCWELRR